MMDNIFIRAIHGAPPSMMIRMLLSVAPSVRGFTDGPCNALARIKSIVSASCDTPALPALAELREITGELCNQVGIGNSSQVGPYAYSQAVGWVLLFVLRPDLVNVEIRFAVAAILSGLGSHLDTDDQAIAGLLREFSRRASSPVFDVGATGLWMAGEMERLHPSVDPSGSQWRMASVILWLLAGMSEPVLSEALS